MWPNKNPTSLLLKMICATAYIGMCLAAVSYNGGFNPCSKLLLAAFILSWLGDALLHMPLKKDLIWSILGAVAFLAAHVFFVCGYGFAGKSFTGNSSFVSVYEIIIALLLAVILTLVCFKLGSKFKLLTVGVIIYCVAVSFMCVKAWSLGLQLLRSGTDNAGLASALLMIGGTCFLLSDFSLALILFTDRFKVFRAKVFNIATYFTAQACLAATIFILG